MGVGRLYHECCWRFTRQKQPELKKKGMHPPLFHRFAIVFEDNILVVDPKHTLEHDTPRNHIPEQTWT